MNKKIKKEGEEEETGTAEPIEEDTVEGEEVGKEGEKDECGEGDDEL